MSEIIDHRSIPVSSVIGKDLYQLSDPGFVESITKKKEYWATRLREPYPLDPCGNKSRVGFLQNNQLFATNLFNPSTPFRTLALVWDTGSGKTMAGAHSAEKYKKPLSEYAAKTGKQSFIYVVSSSVSKANFIRELLRPEFGYVTEKEMNDYLFLKRIAITKQEEETAKKLYKSYVRRIKAYYTFITYQSFQNKTVGATRDIKRRKAKGEAQKKNVLTDVHTSHSLIIVDEAHEMYNNDVMNEYGNSIMKVMDSDPTARLLIMTATPMMSVNTQIVHFINLLVDKDKRVTKRDLFQLEHSELGDRWVPKPGLLEKMEELLRGKVSYFRGDFPSAFPEKIHVGTVKKPFKFLKLIRCPMAPQHLKLYKEVIGDSDKISIENASIFDIGFPIKKGDDKPMGESIMDYISNAPPDWKKKYKLDVITIANRKEIVGDFFKRSNLVNYSTKYVRLLDELSVDGKIIIYHDFRSVVGTRMVAEVLRRNGFFQEKGHDYMCFELIDGEVPERERQEIFSRFNSPDNSDGRLLKIIIAGRVIRQSADFKGVGTMIILNSPYGINEIIQIDGRGARFCSHYDLPPEDRKIYIKILVSSMPDGKTLSSEEKKYLKDEAKYIDIKPIERILKRIAVDCKLFHPNNTRPPTSGQPSECKDKPKPGICPEECDFMSCEYKCYPDFVTPKDLDIRSFETHFFSDEVEVTKTVIKRIFGERITSGYIPMYTFDELFARIKEYNYTTYDASLIDKKSYILALTELIDSKHVFTTEYGTRGYIIHRSEYYVFQPEGFSAGIDLEGRIIPLASERGLNRASIGEYVNTHEDFSTDVGIQQIIAQLNQSVKTDEFISIINSSSQEIQISLAERAIEYFIGVNLFGEEMTNEHKLYTRILFYLNRLGFIITATMTSSSSIDYSKYVTEMKTDNTSLYESVTPHESYVIDLSLKEKKRGYYVVPSSKLFVGHLLRGVPSIYNPSTKKWIQEDLKLAQKRDDWVDNDIVIGYLAKSKTGKLSFKLREPSKKMDVRDRRFIKRGAVCTTYPLNILQSYARKLGISSSGDLVGNLCDAIQHKLVVKEIAERKKGSSVKYFYHHLEL